MKKLVLFLILVLCSCSNEYVNYNKKNENFKNENLVVSEELNDFSYNKIGYLSGITVDYTPDLSVLNNMVEKINSSKKRVYVEVYIFTEKRLRKALIDAHKRGVLVKVLLEKNVYKAPSLNNDTYKTLKNAGINVKYSNPENYSLNHTKLMIVDNEAILSTGNYSYSSFKYNREFFINIKNEEIVSTLESIFEADFEGIKKNIYQDNLILSPFYSRQKIEYILKNAKKNIKIYSLNFQDDSLENILVDKKKEGISVNIIFPSIKKVDSNLEIIENFQKKGISYKILDKPDLHAKAILVDDKYLYLGSVNFSKSSMDKNREVGILISNKEIIEKFLEIFELDFSK